MVYSDVRLAEHPWHTIFFGIFALYVYAALVFGIAGALVPSVADAAIGEGPNATAIIWQMQVLLQVAMLVHFTIWAERAGAGPFAAPIRTDIKWSTIALIVTPVVYLTTIALTFQLFADGDAGWAYRDDTARDAVSRAAIGPVMILSVVILAPLVEEGIYRGAVMGFLLGRGFPPKVCILIAAIGFTALHLQYTPAALIPVFVLGLFLGWLRLASKSLGPPILAHMAVNLQAILGLWAAGT